MSLDPRAVEQRLIDAFTIADRIEPSEDLWTRVVHSIDEDRAHRRRVVGSTLICLGVLLALVASALPFLRDDLLGTSIEPLAFEALVSVALLTVVVTLGPAIRRFGRNYTADLWPGNPVVARSIVRLLDIGYFLVFIGYVLVTVRFDHYEGRALASREHLAEQLTSASVRVGGLLLLIGVLHALTMLALPFVALVDNSTRRGRKLPRWLAVTRSVRPRGY